MMNRKKDVLTSGEGAASREVFLRHDGWNIVIVVDMVDRWTGLHLFCIVLPHHHPNRLKNRAFSLVYDVLYNLVFIVT